MRLRDRGYVMMETTALSKPEVVLPTATIDITVVSSIQREEFHNRSKSKHMAW